MFENAFSFRGRIGRLDYFLAHLLLIPVGFVGTVIVIVMVATAQRSLASLAFFGLLFLLIGIGFAWYSLSLQTRRIRDIGWSPLYVLGGNILLQIVDKMILGPLLPSLALGPHHTGTAIGTLVSLGLTLALLFWPGEDGDTDRGSALEATASYLERIGVEAAARFEPPRPAMAAAPSLAVAPGLASARTVPRKTFGKRGLR